MPKVPSFNYGQCIPCRVGDHGNCQGKQMGQMIVRGGKKKVYTSVCNCPNSAHR